MQENAGGESHQEQDKSEKKQRRGFLFFLIPAALITAMAVFGGLALHDYLEYQAAKNEYSSLDEYISEAAATASSAETGTTEEAAEAMTEADSSTLEGEEVTPITYPDLKIDYDSLMKTNAAFAGVLYVPAVKIRYPFVQGKDDSEYLHKTFRGTYNFAGCVFMESQASKDLTDSNTIIYGHNMKDGTMFGRLKQFVYQSGLCATDPYIYVYTKEKVLKYEIFSYYISDVYSDAYIAFDNADKDAYDAYVAAALKRSQYPEYNKEDIDFSKYPHLLTLSTCSGTNHIDRFLVHAALIGEAAEATD
ncbi:MAG: class B sortase [Lachnospiraceae bacterium]|jgi:sortase B|nr:class B sortase [Lachnospiraceae bacterium]